MVRDPTPQASWNVEDVTYHGCNVIKSILKSGAQTWILMGMYVSPALDPTEEFLHLQRVTPRTRHPVIFMGDVNCTFNGETLRDHLISSTLESIGSKEDLGDHFHL